MADWQLTSCCSHTQVAFIATIGAFIFVILAVSVFWEGQVCNVRVKKKNNKKLGMACHIVVVVVVVGKQRELFLDLSAMI